LLAMFVKVVRKCSMFFRGVVKDDVGKDMPRGIGGGDMEARQIDGGEMEEEAFQPLKQSLADELKEAGDNIGAVDAAEKERMRAMIDSLPLDRYEIANGEASWDDAERQIQKAAKAGGKKSTTVSVKSYTTDGKGSKRKAGEALGEVLKEAEGLREGGGGKNKKGRKSR